MQKSQAKKIVEKYAQALKKNKFSFSEIYIFGSYARGRPRKWSDIDVAVVSDKLKKNRDKNENLLWHTCIEVDSMIEPIGFTPEEFNNAVDPMAHEVKTNGIKIA
jgi:predicted nucleotidyltransferase